MYSIVTKSDKELVVSDFLYMLPLSNDGTVLVIGCEEGIPFVAGSLSGSVRAIDVTETIVETNTERAEREGITHVVFQSVKSYNALPFDNDTFDVIVCSPGVLKQGIESAVVEEAYRVVREGGVMYSAIQNMQSLVSALYIKTYRYTRNNAVSELKHAGFREVSCFSIYPAYDTPRILIPFEDVLAHTFILRNISRDRVFFSYLVRWGLAIPGIASFIRKLFPAYGLLAIK